MTRDTCTESMFKHIASGEAVRQRDMIMAFLQKHSDKKVMLNGVEMRRGFCNHEIMNAINRAVNSSSTTLSKMVKAGYITEAYISKSPQNGRSMVHYRTLNPGEEVQQIMDESPTLTFDITPPTVL